MQSNSWFKQTYKSTEPMPEGIEVGFDEIKLFDRVIVEMKPSDEVPIAKIKLVRMSLEANVHNPATAYYHLLLKKKGNMFPFFPELYMITSWFSINVSCMFLIFVL